MRFPLVAATIVVLSLIACNGPTKSTPGIGPENTLIETPEYTGVIISENGASEFSYLFNNSTTGFWEPSVDDVSRAEGCIRRFFAAMQNDPKLDAYQQEDVLFISENLTKYRRQYIGVIVDGQKRIWCNSFYSDASFPDWERIPVDVDDGGKHFWQIEYDLSKDECFNFYVHGES